MVDDGWMYVQYAGERRSCADRALTPGVRAWADTAHAHFSSSLEDACVVLPGAFGLHSGEPEHPLTSVLLQSRRIQPANSTLEDAADTPVGRLDDIPF